MINNKQIHDFYLQCKEIDIAQTDELFNNAKNDEERGFIQAITNFILQQKQKEVIKENKF